MKPKPSGTLLLTLAISLSLNTIWAQTEAPFAPDWPEVRTEMKPGSRWWWMGSAVDSVNLTRNLEAYAQAGMGSMEITPIYGLKGNEAEEIPFLSPQWMQMLRHTESEATRLGMLIDMNTGTGWPFGGPEVSTDDAACRLLVEEYRLTKGETLSRRIETSEAKQRPYAKLERLMAFRLNARGETTKCLDLTSLVDADGQLNWTAPAGEWRLIAAFCGKTLQKVKRAAPGGEGYVLDHFSAQAVTHYLSRFDRAFAGQGQEAEQATPFPHNMFNDSYEVYKADWTTGFFDLFFARRGYRLEEYLPEFLMEGERTETARRIIADYRETLAELLHENFTRQWTDWAHRHGTLTRNQAHGSPGNLIDLYATVDVPECEGFGLSDFGIRGLRQDSLTRPNDSDLSMLKYASSAAHIAGHPLTSSETFTWLTEHFRTSLSQCKPDLDLMFVSGVNHVFFHGTTYSPTSAPWPGWKFYASVDMSPTNSIWRDAPAFFDYITRCQSFLQAGQPDNDLLVYLPVYDMWYEQEGRLLLFDIHHMADRAPRFIEAVTRITQAGYDVDYISDRFIRSATCRDGQIVTSGGASYRALVLPGVHVMPHDVLAHLLTLARQGATIVFLDGYPSDVPGLLDAAQRRKALRKTVSKFQELEGLTVLQGTDYAATLAKTPAHAEAMKAVHGLSYIRRSHAEGHHYFISALHDRDVAAWIPLAVRARSAAFFNPMDGSSGRAALRQRDGQTEVYLELASGESLILQTFAEQEVNAPLWPHYVVREDLPAIELNGPWGLNFLQSRPEVSQVPDSVSLGSWTESGFPGATTTMGTAHYATTISLTEAQAASEWMLSLGDVRESARIRINGKPVATLWAVPYRCLVGPYLRAGRNTVEVEVTNLPANRIAEMDRQGVVWRIFRDANIARLNGHKGDYSDWAPMPSGLLGPVTLIPLAQGADR